MTMTEAPFIAELSRSLRKSQWLALLPVLAGALIAALWMGLGAVIGVWPLICLALGAAVTAGMIWLQSRLIDQRFLPQIAQRQGMTAEVRGADLCQRLPAGIVTMGTRQVVVNAVSGNLSEHSWQAGFLECSHRELNTGSTRALFRGQLVQVKLKTATPAFVLCPKRQKLAHQHRLYPLGLSQGSEVTVGGREWVLYAADPTVAAEVAQRCALVLGALPAPPARALLLGLVCAEGWLQLLCANKRDLFSLWQGILPARNPAQATHRIIDNLRWAQRAAGALTTFDTASRDDAAS